ncbi:putative MFS family arabinose efflux permease [Saccharothrix carnea]|uniref:Putative MFS family arabinose efflux permease n=1 Tax=Saccharothrix carnea TaxID=1280637 RepID=A0A2P8IDL0_SACCR|nr:MFS transporter [Saccharothrix carnea]PSL56530.1 putative MFS family arabinose efflux permease [Saccharothrix carnea]
MNRSLRWLVVESPRPRRVATWAGAPWLAVATVCLGAFLGQFDASVVTLALPALRDDFDTSPEWVSLAYLLTLAAFVAPIGRWSDRRGRKLVYLYGFVVFTGASVACALARDLDVLIAFRVVQALGAAMLQANSVALVVAAVPRDRARRALGVQATAQALGLALGPTVGGLLVEAFGWQWVFLVNVPVGVVALVAGHFLLPRTHERGAGRVDGLAVVLLATATTALLLVLSGASPFLLLLALPAGAGYVWREPLVRRVKGGLLGASGGYLVLFGPLVLVPFTSDLGPFATGLLLTALPAGFALGAALPWQVPRTGAALSTVACGVLAWQVHPVALVALGLGLGLFTPANNAAVLGALPRGDAGSGGGLVNLARALGTALGVAVPLFVHARWGLSVAFGVLAVITSLLVCTPIGDKRPRSLPRPEENQ